jgi:hypothetical protein
MSFSQTERAVVVSCTLAGLEQTTVDVTVTMFQVEARVFEPKYSDDVYLVRVTKPEGIGDLIDEEGTLMEDKRFFFESTEEIAVGTELAVGASKTAR